MPLGPEKKRRYDHEYQRLYYERNREKILEKRRNRTKEERERSLKSQREWYERNKEQHIANNLRRRRTDYSGTCVVCGKTTIGLSKAQPGSRFCADHRKEQWEEKTGKRVFADKPEPKHSEEQRRAWREAKRAERARQAAGDDTLRKKKSTLITQEEKARATSRTPSFSYLSSKGEKRARVWKNDDKDS